MSEQFLAVAQILVTPDTTGFRTQLQKDLEAAKKGVKVEVLVVPDMTGFRTALIEAVKRSQTNVVARIKVRPDMTGFRAEVAAAAPSGAVTVAPFGPDFRAAIMAMTPQVAASGWRASLLPEEYTLATVNQRFSALLESLESGR